MVFHGEDFYLEGSGFGLNRAAAPDYVQRKFSFVPVSVACEFFGEVSFSSAAFPKEASAFIARTGRGFSGSD